MAGCVCEHACLHVYGRVCCCVDAKMVCTQTIIMNSMLKQSNRISIFTVKTIRSLLSLELLFDYAVFHTQSNAL